MAWKTVKCGLRSKRFCLVSGQGKKRGMGFSVLAAREMKLVPRSLFRNRTERLATQAKLNAWPIESEMNVKNRMTVYLYLHL